MPDFVLPAPHNPQFHLNAAAGRNLVLVFLGSPPTPAAKALIAEARSVRAAFDDRLAGLFWVVAHPKHVEQLGIVQEVPGIRYFMDYEGVAARLYGLVPEGRDTVGARTFVVDRSLRLLQAIEPQPGQPHLVPIVAGLRRLDAFQRGQASLGHAPALVVERVFEPELCRALIDYYNARGGAESGFMRERAGMTVGVLDHDFKRRRDCTIEDAHLRDAAVHRIHDRLLPEIRRAFQFTATRIERHIVARYDAKEGGFFRPHRDNTTKGTAHRRFAVTVNLNADDYQGGDLRFPEYGERTYRAPTGGAVVFSCSLLHEATEVTSGTRYAYLPFLYNDDDADLRRRNEVFLESRGG
ncbi:MAG: 2OG-Fe(II) oxygenase [Reyranellaceae bacterium]